MAREDGYFRLRLPAEIKDWVAMQAERNFRSMTAEINFALRERMATTGEGLGNRAPVAASDETALQGGSINPR